MNALALHERVSMNICIVMCEMRTEPVFFRLWAIKRRALIISARYSAGQIRWSFESKTSWYTPPIKTQYVT